MPGGSGAGSAPRVHVQTARPGDAERTLSRLGLRDAVRDSDGVSAEIGSSDPAAVVAALVYDGVPVRAFGVQAPDLEDVFVGLTGEGFDVSG